MNYQFNIESIDDLLVAAGIIEDDQQAHISGIKIKELAVGVAAIKTDLQECHRICTELGAPDLGGGTVGLLKRLKYVLYRKG